MIGELGPGVLLCTVAFSFSVLFAEGDHLMLLSSLRLISSAFAAIGIVALVLALSASSPMVLAAEPLEAAGDCAGCDDIWELTATCYPSEENQLCQQAYNCQSCSCDLPANGNPTCLYY